MAAAFSKPIAVIADIHGNNDALIAVLADIKTQGAETILNLGDHFSGPLAAEATAKTLLSHPMTSIRGNHDRYLIEQDPETMGPSDRVAYDQLSKPHLDWLRDLPATCTISDQIFLCHGTPHSDTTYWLERVLPSGEIVMRDRQDIEDDAADVPFPLILCAHTHTPRALRLSDGRLIVNPGSVGLAAYDDDAPFYHVMQTGAPEARYALVQKTPAEWPGEWSARWDVTFRAVPYDSAAMTDLARKADRPDWANALATGWLADPIR